MTQEKKKAPRKKVSKSFTRRLFIPAFGMVDEGDKVTPQIEKAWKEWTKEPLSKFTK